MDDPAARHRFRAATAALVLCLLAGCASAARHTAPAAAGFVGYQWRIVAVTHGADETAIPARYRGFVAFATDGTLAAHDGVNNYSGRFRTTAGGYAASEVAGTAVGYAGHDPRVLALVGGVAAALGAHAGARVRGDTLTITAGGYRVRGVRAGPASSRSGAPATSGASSSVATGSGGG